ncbi:hypothetical protein GCM10020256_47630 [Streptomyces thermocoprophilus]
MTSCAKATFSATVLFGSRRKSWKTVPQLAPDLRHLPVGDAAEVLAQDVHLAVAGPLLAQDQPQEGGLSGAGGPHEEDELALLDLQGHIPEGWAALLGVDLGDVVESDHGCTPRVAGGR